MRDTQAKASWEGTVVSVQPRSTVWRYLTDNRTHRECGYNVFIDGSIDWGGGDPAPLRAPAGNGYGFCVAISGKQQERLALRIGDGVKGTGWTPLHPEAEFADLYRAGALKVTSRADADRAGTVVVMDEEGPGCDYGPIPRVISSGYPGPPWTMAAPPLDVYAWRGARMLSKASWKSGCLPCVWANMANVTIQYNFDTGTVRNRFETFCYGPLSCKRYRMGPARSVPYSGRGSASDCGWLDEIMVGYRSGRDE